MGKHVFLWTCLTLSLSTRAAAQGNDSIPDQLRELASQISQLRQELAASRQESSELRREMNDLRRSLSTAAVPQATPAPDSQVSAAAEEQQLLAAKVDDQYQTKVESSSKYRVKLSGMALATASFTHGAVSSLDLPDQAIARKPGESNGALGASMRQSILGLDVVGPVVAGARTRGELRADFFGGLPGVAEGATTGFARLRTGTLAFDWANHSLEAGLEAPFISPRSPQSLVSSAYPALWSSGNLWAWTPQVHVTHRRRVSDSNRVTIQYGLLDALTGEVPGSEYNRLPTAGERHRTPAVASRVAFETNSQDRPASVGGAVYLARQDWGYGRRVNAWTVTADWEVPLGARFSLSGEAYRGNAIAGLGGGLGAAVLLDGLLARQSTRVRPVESAGGWLQAQFKATSRWTFNTAFGTDVPFRVPASLVPAEENEAGYAPRRNASGFMNTIYQPRSNLQFSIEYRRLWTKPFSDRPYRANHIGLGAAVLF